MKKITFLIALSLSITGYSQNWALFPLNQKMYFSFEWPPNVENVDLYLMDSIKSAGQNSILYFNKNLDLKGVGACYNESLEYLNWNPNIFFIDSLIQRIDTIFFYSNLSNTPFYFLPKATIGENWIVKSTNSQNDFDEIIITCSNIQIENFLGVSDSVKTFTLASNTSTNQIPESNKIKLSKHYGLIEFVPFYQFLYHPSAYFYSLKSIGLDSLGVHHGFQQPDFEDYFHLSEGDILFWHRLLDSDFPPNPDRNEYYKDSITQVLASADSIVYIYDRTKQDWNGKIFFYNALSNIFSKSDFQNIVETPPYWLGYGNNHLGFNYSQDQLVQLWKSDFLSIETDSITGDTTTIFSFSSDAFSIDTSNCDINEFIDLGYSFIVNTKYGVSQYCSYSFGSDCVTLTGSIINGILTGSVDFPTATFEIPVIPSIGIHPNPTSNSITINNLENLKELDYKILSSSGKILKYGKLNGNEIQINDLASGFYFLIILNEKSIYHGMFVKQ